MFINSVLTRVHNLTSNLKSCERSSPKFYLCDLLHPPLTLRTFKNRLNTELVHASSRAMLFLLFADQGCSMFIKLFWLVPLKMALLQLYAQILKFVPASEACAQCSLSRCSRDSPKN
jgi:hypothetical protein